MYNILVIYTYQYLYIIYIYIYIHTRLWVCNRGMGRGSRCPPPPSSLHVLYIYIYRERERYIYIEREIYIYIQRERDIDREREREISLYIYIEKERYRYRYRYVYRYRYRYRYIYIERERDIDIQREIYTLISKRYDSNDKYTVSKVGLPPPPMSFHTPSLRYKIPVFQDPDPGKSQPLPMKKWVPEQPRPWRKSCDGESCDGDRVQQGISLYCNGLCRSMAEIRPRIPEMNLDLLLRKVVPPSYGKYTYQGKGPRYSAMACYTENRDRHVVYHCSPAFLPLPHSSSLHPPSWSFLLPPSSSFTPPSSCSSLLPPPLPSREDSEGF